LAALHALVDTFALFLQPLWPDLQQSLGLGEGSVQWAYISWSLATSLSQLFFGYFGDRYRGRWLLWAGPLLGMVCVSMVGWIDSFFWLNCVLLLGGLGVAAFHPEAAAAAGACVPDNRSRAMSIFAVGGYLGQAVGPLYSGIVTTRYGMGSLVWSLCWGGLALAILSLGLRRAPDTGVHASRPSDLAGVLRRRGLALGLILLIGTLRVLPAMGLPLALAYSLKAAGETNAAIGVTQSLFLAGIGVGGLWCAAYVRAHRERVVLWLLPIAVSPVLGVCPLLEGVPLLIAVALSGVLLGGAMPVLISYGQQLLPEAQRLASSITMGVTWGLGSAVVASVMALATRLHRPDAAVYVFAAACLASSLLCVLLPPAHASRGR
jgi:FSR family fosmidomycin resistance protein-like MFS transporter